MNTTYTEGSIEPFTIGSFIAEGKKQFLPYALDELERNHLFVSNILATFHFRTGSQLLVISMLDEVCHFLAIERAAMDYGLLVTNAEATIFEAKRVESIMRCFDVDAVAGVGVATLDGLENLGFDVTDIFADTIVWAYPEAMGRLNGCDVRPFLTLGPALAISCKHNNGLHVDQREWQLSVEEGEICVSNLLPKAMDFNHHKTGIRGSIDTSVCACGSSDPRVHLGKN